MFWARGFIPESFKERTVGWLLVCGSVVVVLSLIGSWAFAMGGFLHGTATRTPGTDAITDAGDLNLLPLCLLFLVCGLGMIGGGIGYALWKERTKFTGVVHTTPNTRVLSRYVLNERWEPIAEYEVEAIENPHFMIRMEISPGRNEEYECHVETYYNCGEGMTGESVLQGKWLSRFTPYIGVRPG
jgi:hypothetical protein